MLGYTRQVTCHEVHNRIYRLTFDVFFASTRLCISEEFQLVHVCLHTVPLNLNLMLASIY